MIKFAMIFVLAFFAQASCQKAEEYVKYKTEADVPRIGIEEAKKDVDAGKAIIIDARPEAAYKAEHIAGAINIPFGEQDKMMDKLPKGKRLIIYCS